MGCHEQSSGEVFRRIYNYVYANMQGPFYGAEPLTPNENFGAESRSHVTSPVVRPDRICPTCAHTAQLFRDVVILMSYGKLEGGNDDGTNKDRTNTPVVQDDPAVIQDDPTTKQITEYN